MKAAAPTFIDLFCGCGGFTLGMLRAGFRCLAAIDFNTEAVATLKANLVDVPRGGFEPPVHALEKDLTKFTPAELAALIGTENLDVIVGGPPCQGFSTARQRDGSNHGTERFKEDPRRHLYRRFLDHVEFFQPRVFVIENVLGLRTAAGGQYFTAVQHEARVLGREKGRLGYRVHAQIENAPELGVPQKRRRQLIVGVRNDLPGYFTPSLVRAKRATKDALLGDALFDLPPLAAGEGSHERDYDLEQRHAFLSVRRGDTRRRFLFDVLEVGRTEKLTNHVSRPHSARDLRDFALLPEGKSSADLLRAGVKFEFPYDKSTFKDRYTRQHRDRPCSTIVAHLSKDGLMFIHPTQNRSLTPREAARVQSFPDWFVFPEARTHAFRLIGNAVPPLVGESVGDAIRNFLDSSHVFSGKPAVLRHPTPTEGTIPAAMNEAKQRLEVLMRQPLLEMRALPKLAFLRGWHALLWLFPELHPDNALDHGEEKLPGVATDFGDRYVRSHWPCSLVLIAAEAWRRFDTDEIDDGEFYCVEAQCARLVGGKMVSGTASRA